MISDEDLEDAPEDLQERFAFLEGRARAWLHRELRNEDEEASNDLRLEYVNKVSAIAKACEIEGLMIYQVPSYNNFGYDDYRTFIRDVDHYVMQIRMHAASIRKLHSVALNDITKEKLRHLIGQVRRIIDGCDIDAQKKDALHFKLDAFSKELEHARTSFQPIAAAWMAICAHLSGQAGEPARQLIESVGALVGRAKDQEDATRLRLPSTQEMRKLEAPRQPEPPARRESFPADLDDEIPF